MQGRTVLFVSVPNLIIELKEAMSLNQLNTYKRKFERYDLVILDELGYVSFDKSGCEILFNLLSNKGVKVPGTAQTRIDIIYNLGGDKYCVFRCRN